MTDKTYTLKISSQGQLTLPRRLQEQLRVQPGARVVVSVKNNSLEISDTLPFAKHYGKMSGAWTADGQDAAEYTRKLRDAMQPKTGPKI